MSCGETAIRLSSAGGFVVIIGQANGLDFPRIIDRGAVVVKTLHPLGPIAARIELPPDVRVPLTHDVKTPAGQICFDRRRRSGGRGPRGPRVAAQISAALAEGVVPGDQVAIAIDEAVPDAANIRPRSDRGRRGGRHRARGNHRRRLRRGFLQEPPCRARRSRSASSSTIRRTRINLALLGLNEKNERLLVNRSIFEADVVLPIGCARLPGVAGSGVFECLFPRLSDAETIGRLRTPSQRGTRRADRQSAAQGRRSRLAARRGAGDASRAGVDGKVAEVVAGDPQAVAERCRRIVRAAVVVPSPAAGEPGDRQRHRWTARSRLGKTSAARWRRSSRWSRRAVRSRFAPISTTARATRSANSSAIPISTASNATCATTIRPTVGRPGNWLERCSAGPVYFLSQLDADDVEEMGMAPIADVDELVRLASGRESCIVLDDSQYAVVTVAGES